MQTFEKEQRLTKSNEQYVEQRRELTQRKEAAIKKACSVSSRASASCTSV